MYITMTNVDFLPRAVLIKAHCVWKIACIGSTLPANLLTADGFGLADLGIAALAGQPWPDMHATAPWHQSDGCERLPHPAASPLSAADLLPSSH